MIARANGSLLFEKWNGPVTMGDGIVCEPNDVAVVSQWGAVKGTLPPGQHAVPMPDVEIFFVRTVPVMGFRGGGALGQMIISHVEVSPRAMFEYGLRVTDPARLAVAVMGQSMDQDTLVQWVNAQVLAAAK
ncbi:MAG TPA: hypothetical protein VH054_29720, partial [Polyangiaceae bacterium]|nr:hypothetical protein [Polyangiaceae bacterium]